MFALCLPMFAYFVCFVVIITQGLNNIGVVLRTTRGGSGIPPERIRGEIGITRAYARLSGSKPDESSPCGLNG